MKQLIDIDVSRWLRGKVRLLDQTGVADVRAPDSGMAYVVFERDAMPAVSRSLGDARFLNATIQPLCDHSVCMQWSFYEKGQFEAGREPTLRAVFGLLPGCRVQVPFDLSWLDGEVLFPPRTLGRLKMTIFGKRLAVGDIARIHLETCPTVDECHLRLWPCTLTDGMPSIEISRKPLIDSLGQWAGSRWPGKTADRASCSAELRADAGRQGSSAYPYERWDRFGGFSGITFDRTGWFHVARDDRRFWLVDPDGHAFISTGIDCLNPGVGTSLDPVAPWLDDHVASLLKGSKSGQGTIEDPAFRTVHRSGRTEHVYDYGIANLVAAFGARQWHRQWTKITADNLRSWGINTIGNWSDPELITHSAIPYVISVDTLSQGGYPSTEQPLFRDFPDVFSPQFEQESRRYARGLRSRRDDPLMVGYFMRNEPAWAFVYGLNMAEETLANPADSYAKRTFVGRLRSQYTDIQSLNRQWGSAFESFEALAHAPHGFAASAPGAGDDLRRFSEELIDRYVRVPADALRQVDGNHLNLGMRYAYITDNSLLAGSDCFDVFSINSYQMNPFQQIERVGRQLDKPVLIGEFHHGALDRGLTAHGIRGVADQRERGFAYRYYVESALESRYFLGAHYFQYNDQSPLGRFDGENYQIGFVDVCMREYSDMTREVRSCHDLMYSLAQGRRDVSCPEPREIPPIHY